MLDTQLSINNDAKSRRGGSLAAKICAVPVLYWRVGLDRAGVAQVLKIKPPHVRQLLYKLGRCWKQIQSERIPGKRGPKKLGAS